MTLHYNHDRHPCPPVGFEPTVSAGERPQTYALDRAATGTGSTAARIKRFLTKWLLGISKGGTGWTQRNTVRVVNRIGRAETTILIFTFMKTSYF